MKFSVLMSIYSKEKSNYFNEAMHSIWDDQIVRPDQIVLVQDGPLNFNLYKDISYWQKKLKDVLLIVPLKSNLGLALALNEGLNFCKFNFIARMDTDDVSTPCRFQKQVQFLEDNANIDVVGSFISEIDECNNIVKKLVKFPLDHDNLMKFFSKRDPFAHPAVMFRKSFFNKAGFYDNSVFFAEDTLLWYQGFMNDCKFSNLDIIGLKFRRTSDFYERRSGLVKSLNLLKFRIFVINRNLGYGVFANIYAIIYFALSISPRIVKKITYNWLR
jgi:glycosyltransferase involved in cell wall biosynthesis